MPRDPGDALHCLEKQPGRRYSSALALAEDLQRFREGKQVAARPVGAVARLARACRRRPLVAALLALLVFSLVGGLSGVTWKWLEANALARQADAEKQAAVYQAYRASLAAASASLQNHDVAGAARLLKLAPESLRGWEWRHLDSRLDDSSAVVSLPASDGSFLINAPDQLRIGVLTAADLHIKDLDGGAQRTLAIDSERRDGVSGAQTRRCLPIAAWAEDTASTCR